MGISEELDTNRGQEMNSLNNIVKIGQQLTNEKLEAMFAIWHAIWTTHNMVWYDKDMCSSHEIREKVLFGQKFDMNNTIGINEKLMGDF